MRKELILSLVFIGILVSGCVEQDVVTPEYHDEALKMETEVTGKVLPDQAINLKVRLTNQVPDDVDDVSLTITDLYGLEVMGKSSYCGGGKLTECELGDIQSLDDREINFVLRVPTKEELARIGRELKPELTLEYMYSGETTFLIPILGSNERSTDAKPQLIQTKGPIHVDIERGFTSSNYDWEWDGSGFSIIMRFEDVLTSDSDITIEEDQVGITLDNLIVSSAFGRCDFDTSSDPYGPGENINLPMVTPIVCALQAQNPTLPWVYGEVKVTYTDYSYESVETKSIQVETVIV